jgi:nickel-dependent lactate racemase
MLYLSKGSTETAISAERLKELVFSSLEKLGPKHKILIIPPDFTRFHSKAGDITVLIHEFYGDRVSDILPALGTHFPMTKKEIETMFPGVPLNLFRVHEWRNDLHTLGTVPGEFLHEVSEGRINYDWPAQVNNLLVKGNYDLIISVGQVVPHEVIGMANYNKNIFVGTGGSEGINKSHFLGAAYGMERIMGRADTPVRQVLDYASDHFAVDLPIFYIQTVIAKNQEAGLELKGVFAGYDRECFEKASDLSLKVNFQLLDKPLKKVVVYLDPSEFKSTWLGNKSIYRTRMAIEDGGELIVLAPGLREFGEDHEIDKLIRKYGYQTTGEILEMTEKNDDLSGNLSAAAHLIHGSSERRFNIRYCPGHLCKSEIESVNYQFGDLDSMMSKYSPDKLKDGINMVNGEEIFYISNPALGLWAFKDRFK